MQPRGCPSPSNKFGNGVTKRRDKTKARSAVIKLRDVQRTTSTSCRSRSRRSGQNGSVKKIERRHNRKEARDPRAMVGIQWNPQSGRQ